VILSSLIGFPKFQKSEYHIRKILESESKISDAAHLCSRNEHGSESDFNLFFGSEADWDVVPNRSRIVMSKGLSVKIYYAISLKSNTIKYRVLNAGLNC